MFFSQGDAGPFAIGTMVMTANHKDILRFVSITELVYREMTPLIKKSVTVAGMLLLGLLVTACDRNTPLMEKVIEGDLAGVKKMLSEAPGQVDVQNNYGWTALSHAVRLGNVEITRLLIEAGADVNVRDKNGWTPLLRAALKGHDKIVAILLEHDAKVNVRENNGWTALMWAAKRGHDKVVRQLLKAGADYRIKDKQGWTAMQHAFHEGHQEIVDMLRLAGARA
ncbi:MAG: ankyrin repeat domain-containing protein [Gammaproteobacteria bacterium]|nr:MAG: ankyrin repeat domain-containing protein [Gammaproteobacteria bacterium]